jgi:hypothetical protein
MNIDVNIFVLIGQLVVSALLVWVAIRKAPVERQTLDATTAAQYAQAAKLKGEENARLEEDMKKLELRLELVERKKYRITMDFEIGDPPELGKVIIEPILPEVVSGIDRNTHLKQKKATSAGQKIDTKPNTKLQ